MTADDDTSPVIDLPCPPGTFLDAAPVHLLTTASIRAIAVHHPDGRWEAARFRPNLLLELSGVGFVEDDWIGSRLRVGSATLSVFAPTVRCSMTVRPQAGLPYDLDIARVVNRAHQSSLGVYAVVAEAGRVAPGDTVEVLDG